MKQKRSQKLWSLFCVGQLLGMESALKCSWKTQWHYTREKMILPLQWVAIANHFLARGWAHVYLHLSAMGPICVKPVQVSHIRPQSLWVQQSCCVRKPPFSCVIHPLWLLRSFCLLFLSTNPQSITTTFCKIYWCNSGPDIMSVANPPFLLDLRPIPSLALRKGLWWRYPI